jgi:sugar lactone lactonase YvrE
LKSQPRPITQGSDESSRLPARRPLKRLILFFLAIGSAIALIVVLTGLLIYNSLSRPRHDSKPLLPSVSIAQSVSLPGDDQFPVGLAAAPDGSFYLTVLGTGSILKVDAKGTVSPFVGPKSGLTAPGAIALGPDNALYVIDLSTTNPYQAVGTLRRITVDSTGINVARFGVSPNGKALPLASQMAFDATGNLYVTNPATGEIWQYTSSGSSAVWWTAPAVAGKGAQPTAIAYDQARNALIIGDAGTGSIYRINLVTDGPIGNPLVLYRQAGLDIQGLALDDQDRVLLTAWTPDNGQLMRVENNGSLTMLADGFRFPTSIVYRAAKVYVVNSDLIGLTPPLLFGLIPSPLRAKPPFTVDVVDLSKVSDPLPDGTPSRTLLPIS